MHAVSRACLGVAIALSACQAPPTIQQASSNAPVAGAPGCPSLGSTVELLRADNGRSANVLTYLQPAGPGEDGLCVTRSGPNRRAVVNIVGRSVHPDARREHARLQSEISALQIGSAASGFVNLPESVGQKSAQFQVMYQVLRNERITVPAGTFDTVVVEEQERNGSCIASWTAWLDKETHLPVKVHTETIRCLQVRQSDRVAGKLNRS